MNANVPLRHREQSEPIQTRGPELRLSLDCLAAANNKQKAIILILLTLFVSSKGTGRRPVRTRNDGLSVRTPTAALPPT